MRAPEQDMEQQPFGDAAWEPARDLRLLLEKALLALMRQATRHHALGQLAQAQSAYRAVLGEQPGHADANHNLAVIALGHGDMWTALRHFKLALDARPDHWQYWVSYLDGLMQAGQCWNAAEVLEDARRAGLAADAVDELTERLLAGFAGAVDAAHAPVAQAVRTRVPVQRSGAGSAVP